MICVHATRVVYRLLLQEIVMVNSFDFTTLNFNITLGASYFVLKIIYLYTFGFDYIQRQFICTQPC